MSAKYWKLVITPLSSAPPAKAATREAVVEGDNWLSALRAARKALGEDGAVPPGASCVMSASGEVTILDSAQRLRYVLARTEEIPNAPDKPEQNASAPAPRAPAGSLPPPALAIAAAPKRAATVAYSPDEAAAIRSQAAAANAPEARAKPAAAEPEAAPKPFSPARPVSRPPAAVADSPRPDPRRPLPGRRPGEGSEMPPVSPEPSASPLRAATSAESGVQAAALPSAPAAPATPAPNPVPAAPEESPPTPSLVQVAPAAAPSAKAPAPTAPAPQPAAEENSRVASRPARKQTVAYSPAEAAAMREQLAGAHTVLTTTSAASSAHDHLVQTEVPSVMVMLGSRDEEPSAQAPLAYRERSYFWPPPAKREEVERALRAELATLRQSLAEKPRGQYVNLAVFDHAFQDKPVRPPIATLQWKDWRGPDPVFAWHAEPAASDWVASHPDKPVTASYFPPAPQAEAVVDSHDRATQPTRRAPPAPVPENQQSKPEATGEQDMRLAVAFEAAQDLYFLSTPADGLDFAVRLLGELIPAEAVSGCIYDINTNEFRFVAVSGTGAAERRAAAVPGNVGLFSVAAHSGRDNLVIPDLANEPRYDPEVDGRSGLLANNMAFFVLHQADQLFGMLQIINREGPKGFRDGDIAVGGYVANQMTAFLRERRGLRSGRS